MKIRDRESGEILDDVQLTSTEMMLLGQAAQSEEAVIVWIRIFHKIWKAGYDKARANTVSEDSTG